MAQCLQRSGLSWWFAATRHELRLILQGALHVLSSRHLYCWLSHPSISCGCALSPAVDLPPCALQRLAALAADAAAAEAYLAPRHVVDVLRDWRLPAGAALGPAELLGTLRQLQPRLYSISSSQVGWGPSGLGVQSCVMSLLRVEVECTGSRRRRAEGRWSIGR